MLRNRFPKFPTPRFLFFLLGLTLFSLFLIEHSLSRRHYNFPQTEMVAQRRKNISAGDKKFFKEEIATRMFKRKLKLKEACSKFGLDRKGNDSMHRPNSWEFLINKKYHLVWCNIFKAASTSWMYNFNILAGYTSNFLKKTNIVPLQLARRRYPRPKLEELQVALNDSISFIIVRHPLERLLSAYRDKIQFALSNTPHQKLGQQIIVKYRNHTTKTKKTNFISNPKWPTLSEFVNYLVDVKHRGQRMDMHWIPMSEFCTPCQISFDIIIKFETLNEDQNYLIKITGLEDKIKPEWKNPSKGRLTAEVLYSYYSQLTMNQIQELYNIYRYDFELFDYRIEEYVKMSKSYKHTRTLNENFDKI